MGPEEATLRAQTLRDQFKEFFHGGQWGAVTVSMGTAAFPDHGRASADVLRAADQALYRAKNKGRDRVERANAG